MKVYHLHRNKTWNALFLPLLILVSCLLLLSSCGTTSAKGLKTEHLALDVSSPEDTAEWWCRNLGFQIVVKQTKPPFAIFIREAQGHFAIELYRAADLPDAPDYFQQDPLQFHVAFLTEDMDADIARLTDAGATLVSRMTIQGSELTMMRDPSGIPIQLVRREQPVLSNTPYSQQN